MKWQPYPSYKDSGVEWLGVVPERWGVDRLKRACEVFPSNVDKKSVEGETEVRLCNYTDVYYKDEITGDLELMKATATQAQIDRFTLRKDDVIITKDSETADDIGIPAYVPNDLPGVVCGYHLSMIRPRGNVSGKFIKRLFDSHYLRAKLEVSAQGLTRVGLGQYEIDNLDIPMPSYGEQLSIATFLDRETTKLDTLIAKQEKLIELLQEKRQAVISHAVTKGLDPDVPMKDSGVEWLGEVPAHWAIWQSRRLFAQRKDRLHPGDEQLTASQKYGVIPQKDFMELEDQRVMQVFTGSEILKHVEPDDFVISMRTFQGGIEYSAYRGCVSSAYVPLIPSGKVTSAFFKYLFKSVLYIQALQSTSNLVRDGQALRFENFTKVPLPKMSHKEQKNIAEFLDHETSKIDLLIEKAQRSIELAKEHRTALISAAVTGKIDVREAA